MCTLLSKIIKFIDRAWSSMKILVPYNDEIVKQIQSIIGDVAEVIGSDRTPEAMLEAGSDAIAVASGRVPGEYILKAKNLKIIQAFGAGIDKIDKDAVLKRGDVIVCNNHENAPEVAEYAIMLLLAVAKRIILSDREMRKGDWAHGWGGPSPSIEIRGKYVLLIGLGNIGREVAKRLRCFDVKITAVTRTGSSSHSHLVDRLVSIDDIEPSVKRADFVILALPLTNNSEALVDEEFLSWMKSSSLLINISRGPIVVESALYDALEKKQIAGAAIDVWWKYPKKWGGSGKIPSEEYPFHELDNVVISPHRAAYSEHIMKDQIQFVAENLLRFIKGESPENIVDMKLGY